MLQVPAIFCLEYTSQRECATRRLAIEECTSSVVPRECNTRCWLGWYPLAADEEEKPVPHYQLINGH